MKDYTKEQIEEIKLLMMESALDYYYNEDSSKSINVIIDEVYDRYVKYLELKTLIK